MKKLFWALVHASTVVLAVVSIYAYIDLRGSVTSAGRGGATMVESVRIDTPVYVVSQDLPNLNTVHESINAQRKSIGAQELRADRTLNEIADTRAKNMEEHAYYGHIDALGKDFFDYIVEEGQAPSYACENLALETNLSANIYVESWLGSEVGHKECLENRDVHYVGYATRKLYDTDMGSHYVVVAIFSSNTIR